MEALSYCQLMERMLAAEARVVELVAENVALKGSRNNLAEFIHEELDADYPLNMNLETPATDRIVAGIKADAVKRIYSFNKVNCRVYLDGDVCMLIDAYEASLRESTK